MEESIDMLSNFTIRNNKIVLKNDGEYFGALQDFEYNIGDKLYESLRKQFKLPLETA